MNSRFQKMAVEKSRELRSCLCVGLDPVLEKLPEGVERSPNGVLAFCRNIIEATKDYVVCFKPNSAFFEALGSDGFRILREVIIFCHYHRAPVILDVKRGDIGSTAKLYAQAAFDSLDADAVTLTAYVGLDGISPFRERTDRSSFILCYTSNPSRTDLQTKEDKNGQPLYMHMAGLIREWNQTGNLGAVVGATAPEELVSIRQALGPDIPILCPGVGAQGGDLEASMKAGLAGDNLHTQAGSLLINASRGVIYASNGADYAQAAANAARKLHEAMQPLMAVS